MPEPAIAIRALSKTLGRGLQVLDRVDLQVEAGEVVGLAGPNGAGKSTLLKILLGLVRPSAGQAMLFGQPAGPGAPVLARVGAMVDGPGFLPYLSGRGNLELARRTMGGRLSPGDFDNALDTTGLDGALDRPYRTYSHGMRYRLGLAMAMMGRPDLLLLDEPTTGLDPAHVAEIAAAISNRARSGASVLVASHDLGFLDSVCARVGFLVGGRMEGCPTMAEVHATAGSLRDSYLRAMERTNGSVGGPR